MFFASRPIQFFGVCKASKGIPTEQKIFAHFSCPVTDMVNKDALSKHFNRNFGPQNRCDPLSSSFFINAITVSVTNLISFSNTIALLWKIAWTISKMDGGPRWGWTLSKTLEDSEYSHQPPFQCIKTEITILLPNMEECNTLDTNTDINCKENKLPTATSSLSA